MKSRLSTLAAVLCLSMLISGTGPGSAQQTAPVPEWLGRMLQEGWMEVEPGVLQRIVGEGRRETFTYGREGLRWTVQRLRERVASLEREHGGHPSPELARIIANLQREITRGEASLQGDPGVQSGASLSAGHDEPAGVAAAVTAGCEPVFSASADASESPGTNANASASYQSPCTDTGNVFSYAYVRATVGSTMTVRSQEDAKYDGTSLTSAAKANVSGSLDCFSDAYARAWSPALGLGLEAADTRFTCPTQTPFRGTPFTVPGTIKAADFDNGGEGVAYHDATSTGGSSYRTTGVDLYDDTVYRLETGEWLEYTIDVVIPGSYALIAQVGSSNPGTLHVELDGVNVTGPLAVPDTGNWGEWGAAVRGGVRFTAGRHVLRVVVEEGFDAFHTLRVVPAQAPFGGTVRTLPGTIRVADFDEGGELISYHDNSAGCRGSCGYRTADVDRWDKVVLWTSPGEWMEYTVDVTATGTYTLAVRVGGSGGGGSFHVEFDGVNVTGPLPLPDTGSWNVFQTVTRTGVSLTAGRKVMRLVVDDNGGHSDAGSFDTISIQP